MIICERTTNYLDEEIKTVSARQAATFEVLWNQLALCCRPKQVVKLDHAEVAEFALWHALTH
jgi:hypothetical protein